MPAYVTVMDTWAAVFVVWAIALVAVSDSVRFGVALVWAAAATMSGMTIMFVASLLNLRKLSPGFRRLAEGEDDPSMPPSGAPYSPPSGQPAVSGLKGRVRTHRWPMSLGQQHHLAMVSYRDRPPRGVWLYNEGESLVGGLEPEGGLGECHQVRKPAIPSVTHLPEPIVESMYRHGT